MKGRFLIGVLTFVLAFVLAFGMGFGMGAVVSRLHLEVKDLRWRVKRLEGKIETMTKPISIEEYITTNKVWITRDPTDNMPMYGVDNNGGLAL